MGLRKHYMGLIVIVLVFVSVLTAHFFGVGGIGTGVSVSLAAQPDEKADSNIKISGDCLSCHEDYDKSIFGTAHRIREEDVGGVACSDCHAGAEAHMEDPDISNIANPGKLGVKGTGAVCASCHLSSHEQTMHERNVHASNDISCSDCHRIHSNRNTALLEKEEVALCLGCHTGVQAQFALPSRHPVTDGVMKCSECHMTMDGDRRQFDFTGSNESCYRCHAQFRGPFPYEHEATVDYATGEGGCLNCHSPHGSTLPRMLKQSYESPHYAICSQCHSVPPGHRYNSQHGSTWAGVSCSECHSDIHGSYTSRMLLSQTLQARGCINAACHRF